MTGKQLKNSILQWAIQGKLVPQDPNDEPASVLLERIREEKARLIKEGKIKKDKNETIIFRGDDNSHYEKILATGEVKCIDDEIPFEIPKSWEWCRLGQILTVKGGKRIPVGCSFAPSATSHIYIRVTEMKNNTLIDKDLKYINEDVFEKIKNYTIGKDDLYLTIAGTIGSVGVVPEKFDGMNLTENAVKLTNLMTNKMFLLYVISSTLVQSQFIDKTKQVAQPKLAIERIHTTLIPFPPLDEQEKIVTKIEELLRIIEHYNLAQTQLNTLNSEINNLLKKSILHEAIQGRLVPQIDSEESATVLLEKIKEEKSRLVKEGRLKKKDLTDSTIFKGDDNKYYEQIGGKAIEIDSDFDFPNTWKVVRLADICRLIDGVKKQGKYICLDAKYLRGKSSGDVLNEGKFIVKGDNIILVDGENSGEVFTVPCEGYMGSTFKQLWVSAEMHLPYMLYFIQFYKDRLRNSKKGAAIPHLNKEIFYNLLIGIPPKDEQMRISEKVAELYSNL